MARTTPPPPRSAASFAPKAAKQVSESGVRFLITTYEQTIVRIEGHAHLFATQFPQATSEIREAVVHMRKAQEHLRARA